MVKTKIETNLLGRRVRGLPPGETPIRDEFRDLHGEIVTVHLNDEGDIEVGILSDTGKIIRTFAFHCGVMWAVEPAVAREYTLDDTDLAWAPGDARTWPPTDEEEDDPHSIALRKQQRAGLLDRQAGGDR